VISASRELISTVCLQTMLPEDIMKARNIILRGGFFPKYITVSSSSRNNSKKWQSSILIKTLWWLQKKNGKRKNFHYFGGGWELIYSNFWWGGGDNLVVIFLWDFCCFQRNSEEVLKNSAILTGVSFFFIFNMARRNYVLRKKMMEIYSFNVT